MTQVTPARPRRRHPRPIWKRPFTLVLAAAVIASALWRVWPLPPLPPILQDLPEDIAAANMELGARMEARFHRPLTVDALEEGLLAEGFDVAPETAYAQIWAPRRNCLVTARVTWTSEDNTVATLNSLYDKRCD